MQLSNVGKYKSATNDETRLDVLQHMSLCRHYVRELRRSVLLETPEADKGTSKRSSQILDQFGQLDDSGHAHPEDEKSKDQHVSAFLRSEGNTHSPQNSVGSNDSPARRSSERPSRGEQPPRPSFMSSGMNGTTDSNSPAHTVARADLRASAEKILYTYLLGGSEREIILPQGILNDIVISIEDDHRDDPEVFDAAKDYVFQAMERDAFPGFLRSKALGNLVPPSMFARLVLGLLAIFGGLWAGFACIFLDKPKHIRCWVCSFWSTLFLLLTSYAANTSFHHRCLFPCFTTIRPRSSPCHPRLLRIHIHELGADTRSLRSKSPDQASSHESRRHSPYRGRCHSPIYFRAWEAIMNCSTRAV